MRSAPFTVTAFAPIVVAAVAVAVLAPARSTLAGNAPLSRARAAPIDTIVTTMDGVYTLAQATRGGNVFAAYCRSCHTPTFHSGPSFRAKWYGRPLADLFLYVKREMPKSEPGSMSDADYTLAIAYLLRINGMPTGAKPLTADTTDLRRIRLDSVPASSSPEGPAR